jgi:hypothetical protein
MEQLDIDDDLPVMEAIADRADVYRTAIALLALREWDEGPVPEDALRLTLWLAGDDV